jgi:hypothetical protein
MHIEDHDTLDRLKEASRQDRNTRTWPRVQAVILAKQGDTVPQIARVLAAYAMAREAIEQPSRTPQPLNPVEPEPPIPWRRPPPTDRRSASSHPATGTSTKSRPRRSRSC